MSPIATQKPARTQIDQRNQLLLDLISRQTHALTLNEPECICLYKLPIKNSSRWLVDTCSMLVYGLLNQHLREGIFSKICETNQKISFHMN